MYPYVKKLKDGQEMTIYMDGSDRVIRSLGYKPQHEVDRELIEGGKKMRRQATKAAKIIELWNSNLTVKENVAVLGKAGIKTNVCYIYALVGKNKLGFKKVTKKVKPSKKNGAVADGDKLPEAPTSTPETSAKPTTEPASTTADAPPEKKVDSSGEAPGAPSK